MKRWYIVTTYSGYENSVKQDLERRRETYNMTDLVFQVLVPEETVEVKDKKGKVKEKVNKLFPGYVFVEMEVDEKKDAAGNTILDMDEDAWFMVRNTPKVTGFLGSSGGGTKPVPVPKDEMDGILNKLGLIVKPKLEFNVGDKILKHHLTADKTPGTEVITTTAWSGDRGLTLVEMGPFGVIGAITPATNPSETVICNSIGNNYCC